jgi:hypothetical protein
MIDKQAGEVRLRGDAQHMPVPATTTRSRSGPETPPVRLLNAAGNGRPDLAGSKARVEFKAFPKPAEKAPLLTRGNTIDAADELAEFMGDLVSGEAHEGNYDYAFELVDPQGKVDELKCIWVDPQASPMGGGHKSGGP